MMHDVARMLFGPQVGVDSTTVELQSQRTALQAGLIYHYHHGSDGVRLQSWHSRQDSRRLLKYLVYETTLV